MIPQSLLSRLAVMKAYAAYQPTSSMLWKSWVIRGTAVDIIVLSTATHKVAKHKTMEIKTTRENLKVLLEFSVG
jgi:hypothetical protein